MAQSVTGSWDALYAVCVQLYTGSGQQSVLVSAGDPGVYEPDLIVAVMGVEAPITKPVMATTRPDDERITIHVLFSAFVAGGMEAQQPANQLAWAASDQLKAYFKVNGNEKLSGACYNAKLTNRTMTPQIVWADEDGIEDPSPIGRVALVDVSVEIWIRS